MMNKNEQFTAWAAGVADVRMSVRPVRFGNKQPGYSIAVVLYGVSVAIAKAWGTVMETRLTRTTCKRNKTLEWRVPAKDHERVLKRLLPFMQNDADVRRGLEFRRLRRGDIGRKGAIFTLWRAVRKRSKGEGYKKV